MADASSALRKLQSGQPLTDGEKKLLGISVTTPATATSTTSAPKPATALQGLKNDSATTSATTAVSTATSDEKLSQIASTAPTQTKKFQSPVEAALGRDIGSSVNYNAMIDQQVAAAQAVGAKPIMSQEQIDGGGVVKWIGGVAGKWQIVMPIGSELVGSKAAGWEGNRNKSGQTSSVNSAASSSSSSTTSSTSSTTTKKEVSRKDNGDGTFTITYDDGTTQVIGTKNDGTKNKTLVSKIDNGDGTFTLNYSDGTSEVIGKKTVTTSTNTDTPTTNIDVLKAALKGMGFSSTIVEASTAFLNGLLRDGLDYDNATEIFLNSKEYTLKNGSKITSPFYTEYGYLNEGLTVPKTANELFNTVEGFKGVANKYKLSSKYLTQDALKAYIKNDVTVADLAERAGTAQLRALEADPFQVNALIKQGFISSAADLADFYLDPKIGKEQLELNRQTGVFTAEALRRAKSGISTSAAQLSGFKQLTATLSAKGYSEAQIAQLAGQGFENISETLMPTTQLAQIYEKAGGTVESNAALTENIQNSLLQEEFMGTASERRKRLSEQNVRAFQGSAGTTTGSLRQTNVLGIL